MPPSQAGRELHQAGMRNIQVRKCDYDEAKSGAQARTTCPDTT